MPASFGDVYDRLCERYPDPNERGRVAFEPLVARVLRTDRGFLQRFAEVWRWDDWPDRDGSDLGIDIVARRHDGEYVAIQCKCYQPDRFIPKGQIDSFLANSQRSFNGKVFTERIIVSTAELAGNAQRAITSIDPPVHLLNLFGLDATTIDWDAHLEDETAPLLAKPLKELHLHQKEALADVRKGFAAHDRGKLIMACGTGKTLTALRIAEDVAGRGGRVLFAAPSISLLQQALGDWGADARMPLRFFAVCSDEDVGKKRGSDGDSARPYDLPIPATTDARTLAAEASRDSTERMTVVFSTYQSMQVIAEAQRVGVPEFDLVICDEAHRTTGHSLQGADPSRFRLVHDGEKIRARKRLYMTATPRIYSPALKQKAEDADVAVDSMDDEAVYGPEFHRLGFATAVAQGLLSDYKVTVLVYSEERIARDFQKQLASGGDGLKVHDVGRVIGCLNGLAKHDPEGRQFTDDSEYPMHRAVAFSNTIKNSKHFVDLVRELQDEAGLAKRRLKFEADHVDGKSGVHERTRALRWLGGETLVMEQQCNILSNARCLTEGIDVPALDAVLFLQPRKSQIDVVQAVGRVMRLAEGKKYGYIILPVVVPATEDPAGALDRNDAYAHVWQVLQALRSHDERFNAYVNKLDLSKDREGPVQVIGVGSGGDESEDGADLRGAGEEAVQRGLGLDIEQWRDAIYAKIVQRCGDRQYWGRWAEDVAEIARVHHERIRAIIGDPDSGVGPRFDEFVEALRRNLNNSITADDAAAMLSQHLITKPVFDALFGGYPFTENNPVSRAMQEMVEGLEGKGIEAELGSLDDFYRSVRLRVEGIDNAKARQSIMADLYDRFFRVAFPRDVERLGIVYTPVPIVDFIIRGVEHLLHQEFNASLSDEGVHVLDPFTGTGTFITRLLQSSYIRSEDRARKYAKEVHANEIMLLAYYIAAVNIETTYTDLENDHIPFEGIVLTDTFQQFESSERKDTSFFPRNTERIERQIDLDIQVVISNPPWSKGQRNQNDNNQRQPYPDLDRRISETFVRRSSSRVVPGLYDSYVRAIRWAANRVLDRSGGGIVGFVTNGGYVDGNSFDGFRKTLAAEFHSIYIFNLRGNSRLSGDLARREGENVFPIRVPPAIIFLVKRPEDATGSAQIHYYDVGDNLTRDQKLGILDKTSLDEITWVPISPDANGDWINQRTDGHDLLRPLIERKQGESMLLSALFLEYSFGMQNKCDPYVINSSQNVLNRNVTGMVSFFNDNLDSEDRDAFLASSFSRDLRRFKWTVTTEKRFLRGERLTVSDSGFRKAAYRPFFKQNVYFDSAIAHSLRKLPSIFPDNGLYPGIIVTEKSSSLGVMAVNALPDDAVVGPSSLYLPKYTSGDTLPLGNLGHDVNISDAALADYRALFGDVSKDDIFSYVYAVLHSPDYRSRYAVSLGKELPRIPEVATADAFHAFAAAGRRLFDLHIGYEDAEPYPLEELWGPLAPGDAVERHRVEKMRWGGKRGAEDRTRIVYNEWLTLAGIPEEAHGYAVGPRTALEWLIDRYRVRTDKASGIVNDVNDWGLEQEPPNPRYVVELVKRIVTVSVETVRIVGTLPPLEEAPPG